MKKVSLCGLILCFAGAALADLNTSFPRIEIGRVDNIVVPPSLAVDPNKIPDVVAPRLYEQRQVIVIKPVTNRLPQVPLKALKPETKFTLGLFDESGNINGSRDISAKDAANEFDVWANTQKQTFARFSSTDKVFSNVKVSEVQEFDQEIGQNMTVVDVPMNPQELNVLWQQRLLSLKPLPALELKPVSSSTVERTYDNSSNYSDEWGSKSLFSAYVNSNFKIHSDKQAQYVSGNFAGGGYVFTKKVPLIDFYTMLSNGKTPDSKLLVLDQVLWSTAAIPVLGEGIYFDREKGDRKHFSIGPVPVSVGGSIGGKVGVSFNITANMNNKSVKGTVSPSIESYATADVAVDAYVARVGIQGVLTIVKQSIPVSVQVAYNQTLSRIEGILKLDTVLESLSGKLKIYAKVGWGWFSKTFKLTIFSWEGFVNTWNIFQAETYIPLSDVIGDYYRANGGENKFGVSLSDEQQIGNGLMHNYSAGTIYWSEKTKAQFVLKATNAAYRISTDGFPLSLQQNYFNQQQQLRGFCQDFERAVICYNTQLAPDQGGRLYHKVKDRQLDVWTQKQRMNGCLGFPVSGVYYPNAPVSQESKQDFEGGYIESKIKLNQVGRPYYEYNVVCR